MIAIVVGAILLTAGVSGFESLIARNRVRATVNDLLSTLALARQEALRDHHPVIVCASSNGSTCKGSSDWSGGWVALEEQNQTGSFSGSFRSTGAGGRILRAHPALNEVVVDAVMNGVTTGFNGYGFPILAGRFLVSEPNGKDANTVCLTVSGEIYASAGTTLCR